MAEAKTSVERLLSPVRELIESTAVMSAHLRDAIRVSNLFGEAFFVSGGLLFMETSERREIGCRNLNN
jgi:hypothetical protein